MTLKSKNASYYLSSVQEQPDDICKWHRKFHSYLEHLFYNLGYSIATSPRYFILVPVILSLFFVTGFQSFKYEKDPEYLFSPWNAKGRVERKIIEDIFPVNYSHTFHPSRITQISPMVRLLITAKDNDTILRSIIWKDIMSLDSTIQKITINLDGDIYKYEDVCAMWNSRCVENQILNLNEIISEVETGDNFINYPVMLFPRLYPFYYGGVTVNTSEGYLKSAKSISLHYWLKGGGEREKQRSITWEKQVLNLIKSTNFTTIHVAPFVSMSLEDELERNTNSIITYLPPTVLIMIIFSIISVSSSDWVRCKIQLCLMGVLTAGLGTACSFGLLMYCNVPFIGINLAAPFLLIGIGIDDMFVVLSSWRRTHLQDDVPTRLAETYREAAISITITSLTNMLSFVIGTLTPFPSVYIFCTYTGVAVALTYVFFITFFGGCLALAGYQEKRQKHAITCLPLKSKSETKDSGWCYSLWCSGGISPTDPWNGEDNQPHFLMTCFKRHFARALNTSGVKVIIIGSFLLYMIGAIYGCLHLEEGLQKRILALDDSYMTNYYDIEDAYYRKFPYRIQVVINENVTYSDPETQRKVLKLHKSFEDLKWIGKRLYTESWLRGFLRFLFRRRHLRDKITDEKSFVTVLREEYLTPENPEKLDVVFNEDKSQIVASRFIFQSYDIKDTNDDKEMMVDIRKVAEKSPFNVTTYHPLFVFFDQFVLVAPLTMQTISLVAFVMMVISSILIPNPLCCLLVILSIISIEVGVIGYMAIWGVRLDCISMINLIMCLGFSVDFSAHISYAYLTAKGKTPEEKVEECMFNLGLPVIQSGISTVAGVFSFVVAPSNIFRTFFKIICLVITFGTLHAILLLPVLLSLFGPGSCQKQTKTVSLTKVKDITSERNSTSTTEPASNKDLHTSSGEQKQSSDLFKSTYNQETLCDSDTESTRASKRSLNNNSNSVKRSRKITSKEKQENMENTSDLFCSTVTYL